MKTDTIWNRFLKHLLPVNWRELPPADVERNTNTLARLAENDPVLACVRDHAFAQFSNDLAIALDTTQPAALRLSHADSASGVRRFIEDLELRREGWNEDRIRREREEATANRNKKSNHP